MLLFGGSLSRKTNELLNIIKNKADMHKIYLYAKDPYEAKYQLLINKRESTQLICLNDSKVFIQLSLNKLYEKYINDIYKNIEEYNPNKKIKISIVFDDMIADLIINKKLILIVAELFIRGRKSNISLLFITQPYFTVPKNVRLNSAHNFVIKIPKKEKFKKLCLIILQILTSRFFKS